MEKDGVPSLSVGVLEAAVESVVTQGHLGQDEFGAQLTVLGSDVRPVHLPRHRGVTVQGAAP